MTRGKGIAAASSTTTNSAWPNLFASVGWMYCNTFELSLKKDFFPNLNSLSVLPEDVDSDESFAELGIRRLDQFVVGVLLKETKFLEKKSFYLILNGIESLDDELEERSEIFWRRRRHENVRVAECDGARQRESLIIFRSKI